MRKILMRRAAERGGVREAQAIKRCRLHAAIAAAAVIAAIASATSMPAVCPRQKVVNQRGGV